MDDKAKADDQVPLLQGDGHKENHHSHNTGVKWSQLALLLLLLMLLATGLSYWLSSCAPFSLLVSLPPPSWTLCIVDISSVNTVYQSLAERLFLEDRSYRLVPAGAYTTADISAVHQQHPDLLRWRWKRACHTPFGCSRYPSLFFVDRNNTEHLCVPGIVKSHESCIQQMLNDTLFMWTPYIEIPAYMDILINPGDKLTRQLFPPNTSYPRPPVFSAYSVDGAMDVPFTWCWSWKDRFLPMEHLLLSQLQTRQDPPPADANTNCTAMATPTDRDWNRRRATAFWRGSTTGAVWTPTNFKQLVRYRLAEISQSVGGGLIDARITYCTQCEPKAEMEQILQRDLHGFWNVPFDDESALFRVRAVIDVDGNSWSSRFPQLLASGAIVLKQRTDYKEFWYHLLLEYVHYIPVKSDLSDLISKAKSVLEQQQYRDVAAQSVVFARTYLTPTAIHQYMRHILILYSRMLQVPDRPP